MSPDLLELSTALQGLQNDVLNTIKPTSVHHSILELLNTLNIALCTNEISAKPFTNLILPKGSKQARRQAHTAVLANLSTLSSYYAGFATGLVKDINQTRSSSLHRDNLPPEPRNLKELRKHPLTAGFQIAMEKEYNDLKRRGTFKTVQKAEACNEQILPLKWVFKYKFDSNGYLQKLKAQLCV